MPDDNEDESKRLRDNSGMDLRPQNARHDNLAPRGMAPSFGAGRAPNLRPDAVDKSAVTPSIPQPSREFNQSANQSHSSEKEEKGALHSHRTGDREVDDFYSRTHVIVEPRDKSDGHER